MLTYLNTKDVLFFFITIKMNLLDNNYHFLHKCQSLTKEKIK